MIGNINTEPLTRRLVSRYLVFGLAGLFLCLITTLLSSSFRGHGDNLVLLSAVVPLLILGIGAVVVHQSVQFHGRIERQLLQVCANPLNIGSATETLAGNDPAVQGWNTLLNRLAAQESLVTLEERLSGTVGQRRDQRATLILQSLPKGVALTESDGTILCGNRSLAVLVEIATPDELVGKNLFSLLRLDVAHNRAAVQKTFQMNGSYIVCELHRSAQLSDGVLRISRSNIVDPGNGLPRSVWVVSDVTQQSLVDDARKQFVSLATHELRTPLANIKAYAETLAIHEGIDVERQKEFCNIINSEATRLSRFVDEMLSVSQIEAGAMALDCRETDLERLVTDVIEHVRPQMDQKKIRLEVKLPPKFPTLKLDKDKFSSALVNLLGNAAKYTPDGGSVTFEIKARGTNIDFCVADTGIGIAPEDLPRVFERFFRSGDPRVKNIDGNGLGLTFSQEVLHLLGGRLTVESELNRGTRFVASLPLPDAGAR